MKRFDDIAIGPDYLAIDRRPMHWWPVKVFLHLVHVTTRCRGCMWVPVWCLEHKYLNTPSKETFRVPVTQELRVQLAASYNIPLDDDWDKEELDDETS